MLVCYTSAHVPITGGGGGGGGGGGSRDWYKLEQLGTRLASGLLSVSLPRICSLNNVQLDNYEEGAKCFYTFMFYNMESDLIVGNDVFYRKTLQLGKDEFVWREPPTQPHQDIFLEGQSRGSLANCVATIMSCNMITRK